MPKLDIDALAFLNATAITDPVIRAAINVFVIGLKTNNLWNKVYALYPYVGGSAATHSYNLRNTLLYQITWFGGITHNSNGVTANGTTGYGDTGLNALSVMTANNTAVHSYIRDNVSSASSWDMGATVSTVVRLIYSTKVNTASTSDQYNSTTSLGRLSYVNSTSVGMYSASRIASNNHKIYLAGVQVASNTGSGGTLPSLNIFVRALNNMGVAQNFTSRNCALDCISQGFSSTEAANFYTLVQQLQTTLGRQI